MFLPSSRLPFRWNLAERSQLGSLLEGEPAEDYPEFVDHLRDCCARVVASAGDGDLVFVGRSPESLFDYLGGILAETSWKERICLFNFSMRYATVEEVRRMNEGGIEAIQDQLTALGLAPDAIASAERPIVFVDLVQSGDTFGRLLDLLEHWAAASRLDPAAVRRRVRFVGITIRSKNSPNTWRWYQQVEWASRLPRRALRSISIPFELWTYLGEWQKKVSRWNPPMWWGEEALTEAPRENSSLQALRLAYATYRRGSDLGERRHFAGQLAAQPEMRNPWLRKLVLELRP